MGKVGKFKNGKAPGKDEVTVEMVKGRGDMVVDWIWRLCDMTFENVVPEDWTFAVIVPLYIRVKERVLNVRIIEGLPC